MLDHPELGLVPAGFLGLAATGQDLPLPLLGRPADLAELTARMGIRRIIVCRVGSDEPGARQNRPADLDDDLRAVLRAAQDLGPMSAWYPRGRCPWRRSRLRPRTRSGGSRSSACAGSAARERACWPSEPVMSSSRPARWPLRCPCCLCWPSPSDWTPARHRSSGSSGSPARTGGP